MTAGNAVNRPSIAGQCTGLINGAEAPATQDRLTLIDPATAEAVCELFEQGPDAVDVAVRSARQAFRAGTWSRRPLVERAAVLQQAAQRLRDEGPDIAAWDSRTTGLLHHAALAPQSQAAAGWLDYFAASLLTLGDDLYRQIPY
ncbi:MAG: aldehyde dehydrogenase family protein, partial [Chromatocurvus sp.]